jgi:hypothetical protein
MLLSQRLMVGLSEMSDEEILRRLLALNLERANAEAEKSA